MRTRLRTAACAAALLIGAGAALPGAEAQAASGDAGFSFNSAPEVGPGTYRQTTVVGEYLFWRIDVGRGQRLTLKAGLDVPADFPLDNRTTRFVITVYNPLREATKCPDVAGKLVDAAAVRVEVDCGPWTIGDGKKYESESGGDEGGGLDTFKNDYYETPGTYYAQIGFSRQKDVQKGRVLPVDLTVSVDGTAQADQAEEFDFGAPNVPGLPGAPSPAPGTTPGQVTPVAAPRDDDENSPLVPIGAGVGGLVLAGGVAYTFGARRREPAAATGWSAPAQPGSPGPTLGWGGDGPPRRPAPPPPPVSPARRPPPPGPPTI